MEAQIRIQKSIRNLEENAESYRQLCDEVLHEQVSYIFCDCTIKIYINEKIQ